SGGVVNGRHLRPLSIAFAKRDHIGDKSIRTLATIWRAMLTGQFRLFRAPKLGLFARKLRSGCGCVVLFLVDFPVSRGFHRSSAVCGSRFISYRAESAPNGSGPIRW